MFAPAVAVAGPLFVTPTSAPALGMTVVVALAVLLVGSVSKLSLVPDTVFVIEVVLPTRSTRVNSADVPSTARLQLTVPVPLGAGFEHEAGGPVFCTRDTKVVLGGRGSVSWTLMAGSGPSL